MRKKLLLITVATVFVLGLSGCNSTVNKISDETETKTEATTQATTEATTTETVGQTTTTNLLTNVYASMSNYSYCKCTLTLDSTDDNGNETIIIDSKNKYTLSTVVSNTDNTTTQIFLDFSNNIVYTKIDDNPWTSEGDIENYKDSDAPYYSKSMNIYKEIIESKDIQDYNFKYLNEEFSYIYSASNEGNSLNLSTTIDAKTLLPISYVLKYNSNGTKSNFDLYFYEFSNDKELELPSDLPVAN